MSANTLIGPNILLTASIAIWLGAIGFIIWPITNANFLIQITSTLFAIVLSIQIIRIRRQNLFLSPLYILGIISLVFFGLGPTLFIQFFPLNHPLLSVNGYRLTTAFVGSAGELYILQFAAMCFALTTLVIKLSRRGVPEEDLAVTTGPKNWNIVATSAPLVALSMAMIFLAGKWIPAANEFLAYGAGRQIQHALMPILSLALVTMGYIARAKNIPFQLFNFIVGLLAITAAIVAQGMSSMPVFAAIVALGIFIVGRSDGLIRLIAIALLMAVIVIAAISTTRIIRPVETADQKITFMEKVFQSVATKLVLRQGVSGYCLDRIVRQHQRAESGNPFYFIFAVVPRILWQAKPNLSLGPLYAERYCGQKNAVSRGHSEAFTLIGEPLLHTGSIGLVVAQLFIVVIMVPISLIGTSGRTIPFIVMTAMLPWLASFEALLAQYTGNIVKMFLFMLPFIVALSWCYRKRPMQN